MPIQTNIIPIGMFPAIAQMSPARQNSMEAIILKIKLVIFVSKYPQRNKEN
ncbi:MAG: hypothetical protein WDK96_04035 [Candidatus Paceibacterota bacterium]|jgi:hypothetical protein